jgi:hypothetical protein
LDLVEGLDGVEYFLLFSFFDQIQTKQISITIEPSVATAISHTPSSSPFPSSSSHPQKVLSRRTATAVKHCSVTSQLNILGAAFAAFATIVDT